MAAHPRPGARGELELFGGGPGGPGGGGGFGGAAGLQRLFTGEIGGQATWLLPAALLLLVAGGWVAWKRRDQDKELRGSLVLWGGWTVVTFLVFSLAEGIFHPYYTVALAPGIAALVGIGGVLLWRERAAWWVRAVLAVAVAGTAAWAFVLLGRTPEFLPWLRWVVVVAGALAVLGIAGVAAGAGARRRDDRGERRHGPRRPPRLHGPDRRDRAPGQHPDGRAAGRGEGGEGGMRGPGRGTAPRAGDAAQDAQQQPRFQGGPGGPQRVDAEVAALLSTAGTDWSAAAIGSMSAAGLALASDTDVMAIGGFNGGDPAPTLAAFQADVAAGRIHWFVGGGERGGPGGGRGSSGEISTWVEQHFTATTVGGMTLYDLTAPK